MIIPDANLLLYAYDEASQFHQRAASWWRALLDGAQPIGLLAVVLFAYVRVGTSAKVFDNPLSASEAAGHIRAWLDVGVTELIAVTNADVGQALDWVEAAGTGGNLTTDAQIAAVAKRCRAVVHTADTDFARFGGVRSANPLM